MRQTTGIYRPFFLRPPYGLDFSFTGIIRRDKHLALPAKLHSAMSYPATGRDAPVLDSMMDFTFSFPIAISGNRTTDSAH